MALIVLQTVVKAALAKLTQKQEQAYRLQPQMQ